MNESMNPAIALLAKQREAYCASRKRLDAQLKGVETKLADTSARIAALDDALSALTEQKSVEGPGGGKTTQ